MNSKPSIFGMLVVAVALSGAANASVDTQPAAAAPTAVSTSPAAVNTGAAVMPAAVFAAGAGALSSAPHAAALGAAVATSEEALPEPNLAMLLLAALAAMGSVVIRRSGGR